MTKFMLLWWALMMGVGIAVVYDGEASRWWIQFGTILWAVSSFMLGLAIGNANSRRRR